MTPPGNNLFGHPDVIVVGAGNAAACAALAARENGSTVIMLEAAPIEECGGNDKPAAMDDLDMGMRNSWEATCVNSRSSTERTAKV